MKSFLGEFFWGVFEEFFGGVFWEVFEEFFGGFLGFCWDFSKILKKDFLGFS